MKLSVAYIIQNEEDWIKHSLESILPVADEVIMIDGGSTDRTLDIIDELDDTRISVIHHKYDNNYQGIDGLQRNKYLKYLTGDWCLVIDGDEVASDNIVHLKKFLAKVKNNVFDVHMEHFVRDFAHVDATKDKHFVPRRLFKVEGNESYPIFKHSILSKPNERILPTSAITLFHMGYTESLIQIHNKYRINIEQEAQHGMKFLKQWNNNHLFGGYPVRKYDGPYPRCIREMIV